MWSADKVLGAHFFFARGDERGSAEQFISTIARRLADYDSVFKKALCGVMDRPSEVPSAVKGKFDCVILGPSKQAFLGKVKPILIVIDAIDECREKCQLAQALSTAITELSPRVKFFITSRPLSELDVLARHTAVDGYQISKDKRTNISDIRTYIEEELSEVSTHAKSRLAERSHGLFIWSSTACKLLKRAKFPDKLLPKILDTSSSSFTASTSQNPVLPQLHELYVVVLMEAFPKDCPTDWEEAELVLGVMVAAHEPLSVVAIDALLQREIAMQVVNALSSVLHAGNYGLGPVNFLHPTFPQFLAEPRGYYCIDCLWYDGDLAVRCVELLDRELGENICRLSYGETTFDGHTYMRNISDALRRAKLSDGLSYACVFWIEHVCAISDPPGDLGELLYAFLCAHLLHWFEAMSILKKSRSTIGLLSHFLSWITATFENHSALHQLVDDAYRLSKMFADAIEHHPLSIYRSAVPFAPNNTTVYNRFSRGRMMPRVRRLGQVEHSWTPLLQTIRGHFPAEGIAFSPDGKKIAGIASSDYISHPVEDCVTIWDAESGEVDQIVKDEWFSGRDLSYPMPEVIMNRSAIAFCTNDGTTFISVGSNPHGDRVGGLDRVWDLNCDTLVGIPISGRTLKSLCVGISADGTAIAAVSWAPWRIAFVWNVAPSNKTSSIQYAFRFKEHVAPVCCISFCPNAGCDIIATASMDGAIRVWFRTKSLPPFLGHGRGLCCARFSPDGKRIVSGSEDMTIRVWDISSGSQVLPPLRGHAGAVTCIAVSPDGTRICSGSTDCTIRIWDSSSGAELYRPFQGHFHSIVYLTFSPNGTRVASSSLDKTVRVWDVTTPREQNQAGSVTTSRNIPGSLYSTDPTYHLAALGLPTTRPVTFSSTGTKIATGLYDGSIQIWDSDSPAAAVSSLNGHCGLVEWIAFSPDDGKVLSTAQDGTIKLWDVASGDEILSLLRPPSESPDFTSVRFSHGGKRIVFLSASEDWDVPGIENCWDMAGVEVFDTEEDLTTERDSPTPNLFPKFSILWRRWIVADGDWDKLFVELPEEGRIMAQCGMKIVVLAKASSQLMVIDFSSLHL